MQLATSQPVMKKEQSQEYLYFFCQLRNRIEKIIADIANSGIFLITSKISLNMQSSRMFFPKVFLILVFITENPVEDLRWSFFAQIKLFS